MQKKNKKTSSIFSLLIEELYENRRVVLVCTMKSYSGSISVLHYTELKPILKMSLTIEHCIIFYSIYIAANYIIASFIINVNIMYGYKQRH